MQRIRDLQMFRDTLWEHLQRAVQDQIPSLRGVALNPNEDLYTYSPRQIDWCVILSRLLPEGITISRLQEDQVLNRTCTLHDLVDYVQNAIDDALSGY